MARKKFTKADFRRALRKVRTKLLNGTITKEQFRMESVLDVDVRGRSLMCGTRACIGGHMAIELDTGVVFRQRKHLRGVAWSGLLAGTIMQEAEEAIPNLSMLFFGFRGGETRRKAANAITRALDGKKDPWSYRGK